MDKIKPLILFAGKVFIAITIINVIMGFLPGAAGAWLSSFQRDPIGTLKNGNA